MNLQQVFYEIGQDRPWLFNTRLVVGSLAARESVKEVFLQQQPVLPAYTIIGLTDLAKEIITSSRQTVTQVFSFADQVDCLENLIQQPWIQEKIPLLAKQLRMRKVAEKVALFLKQLDLFYLNHDDLSAVIDYYQEKDQQVASLIAILQTLWQKPEFAAWGEGFWLRQAINCLEQTNATALQLPQRVWFWGVTEFTPLEEKFLAELSQKNIELKFLTTTQHLDLLKKNQMLPNLELHELDDSRSILKPQENYQVHSIFDAIEFFLADLKNCQEQNISFNQIGVFLPNNAELKKYFINRLQQHNIAIQDPTLVDDWKKNHDWVRTLEWLRALANGLKLNTVLAFIEDPQQNLRQIIIDWAYQQSSEGGVHFLKKIQALSPHKDLEKLINGFLMFSKRLTVHELQIQVTQWVSQNQEFQILAEFAEYLVNEREFLHQQSLRLKNYLSYFEEYLKLRSREYSAKNLKGIHFNQFNVWLAQKLTKVYVFQTEDLPKATLSKALWDWEGLEVRKAYQQLHFGLSWSDRVARDQQLLDYGMLAHQHVTYYNLKYDLNGKEVMRHFKDAQVLGGHARSGWRYQFEVPQLEPFFDLNYQIPETMSVSQFDDYLKCKFLFYGRHVLKIEPSRQTSLEVTAQDRGVVLHNVLKIIIEQEIADSSALTKIYNSGEYKNIVKNEFNQAQVKGLFKSEKLKQQILSNLNFITGQWLESEIERRKLLPNLKPQRVEEKLSINIFDKLTLRGRLDRFDADENHFVLYDYKTSHNVFIGKELLLGASAQLVLYAQALAQKLKKNPAALAYIKVGPKVELKNGLFFKEYNKQYFNINGRSSSLVDQDFAAIYSQLNLIYQQAYQDLKAKNFSPEPRRGTKECDSCWYRSFCQYPQVQNGLTASDAT